MLYDCTQLVQMNWTSVYKTHLIRAHTHGHCTLYIYIFTPILPHSPLQQAFAISAPLRNLRYYSNPEICSLNLRNKLFTRCRHKEQFLLVKPVRKNKKERVKGNHLS